MLYRIAADTVLILHLAFIAYVVLGGLLAFRFPRSAWIHLPVASWGVLVEVTGWGCPLTLLENLLLQRAGGNGYPGGFLEHYLLSLIYPEALTRNLQFLLAALVLVVNGLIYGALWYRARY